MHLQVVFEVDNAYFEVLKELKFLLDKESTLFNASENLIKESKERVYQSNNESKNSHEVGGAVNIEPQVSQFKSN